MLKSTKNILSIVENHPVEYVKYHRGLEKLHQFIAPPIHREIFIEVFWGPSGSGKTKRAFEENPDAYWLDTYPWFDGYTGQKTVIIDDFDDTKIPRNMFLRLCDRYPLRVQIKGATTAFLAEKIVFTSNFNPIHWYGDNVKEISRRLNAVYCLEVVR